MLPSITWSPLPPRRATVAAAQSLCVTLFCDDTLDDLTDVTARIVATSDHAKAGKIAKFGASAGTASSAAPSVSFKTDKYVLASPPTCSKSDLPAVDDVFGSPNVFSIVNPYVPLNATPNLNVRNENILDISSQDLLKMNIYPSMNIPTSISSRARPTVQNYKSPLDYNNSPLHISHTPYSPPISTHTSPFEPPPLSCSSSSLHPTATEYPKYRQRSSTRSRTLIPPPPQAPQPNPPAMSSLTKDDEYDSYNEINIASLSTPVTVTDAALTAHLPPWHSIGNISLSYLQYSADRHHRNQKKRTSKGCSSGNVRSRGLLDEKQSPKIQNQKDVLEEYFSDENNSFPVVQSSPSNSSTPHVSPFIGSPQLSNKGLDLPLKKSAVEPLSPSTSAAAAHTATTASPGGVAYAQTPISPSESILSTGFQLSSSSGAQKPCTNPRDTPTHQPSITSPTRRVPPDRSTHDLRLDSIHDLNWLNAMEPEDQVLLEVHVVWSILTLMVVLLACYTLHHHPLTG